MQEIKSKCTSLEDKLQKLINLHEDAKKINSKLLAEKRQMLIELTEEREKAHRMQEGYKNLKDMEKSSSVTSISNMKRKINEMIMEIDRNMSLIQDKNN